MLGLDFGQPDAQPGSQPDLRKKPRRPVTSTLCAISRHDARVRFGITGNGIQPNYQIEYQPEGGKPARTLAFRGSTHKPYGINEPFNEERISDAFAYGEIERAYSE